MSTTTSTVNYSIDCSLGGFTSGGSQFGGNVEITVVAGTDFTDADLFALEQALIAAFPAVWGVVAADFGVSKSAIEQTTYTPNATATPPTFS